MFCLYIIWVFQAVYDMDYMLSVNCAYCMFRTNSVMKSWLQHLWMLPGCVDYTFDFWISFWSSHIQKPFTLATFLWPLRGVAADSLTGCSLWNVEMYLQINFGLIKIHSWKSSAWQWLKHHRTHDLVTDAENCLSNFLWLEQLITYFYHQI